MLGRPWLWSRDESVIPSTRQQPFQPRWGLLWHGGSWHDIQGLCSILARGLWEGARHPLPWLSQGICPRYKLNELDCSCVMVSFPKLEPLVWGRKARDLYIYWGKYISLSAFTQDSSSNTSPPRKVATRRSGTIDSIIRWWFSMIFFINENCFFFVFCHGCQ